MQQIPLVVDLDHTLIHTDLLQHSSICLLKKNPLYLIKMAIWFIKGKAYLKHQIRQRITIDIGQLPYNQTMLSYIKKRQKQGCQIILATASNQHYAKAVAKHLACFDAVFASDASFNLSSNNKAEYLIKQYGRKNFDYAGDHNRDIVVWQASRLAILVNASKRLKKKVKRLQLKHISL